MKSTNAEIEVRVATVAEMIIKGQTRDKIIRYSSDNWDIGERQTENYISKAWDKIKDSSNDLLGNHIKLAIERYNDLYQKSYNIQDYRECRQVMAELVKMLEKPGYNQKDNREPTKLRAVSDKDF